MKTATKPAKKKAITADGFVESLEMVPGEFRSLPIVQVRVSPFEAQARRRSHFTEPDLEELGNSIKSAGGLIHAIVVRPITGHGGVPWEIVAGERRYLAASRAGYTKVDCVIKDLSDDQVRNIQLIENLQRKEPYAVDEGFDYQDLMKLRGWTVAEVALQVGKSEKYIHNRLKLTGLIEEIRKDIDAHIIPLTYALEIAKFEDAETQKEIYDEVFTDYNWSNGKQTPDKKAPIVTFQELRFAINNNFTLQLAKAPFDVTATNLRTDGLACGDCPQRTGAAPGLFEEYDAGQKDCCLNKACYDGKIAKQIGNARAVIAQDQGVDIEEVPVVNLDRHTDEVGVLGQSEVTVVPSKDAGKPGVIRAVSTAAANFGEQVLIRKREPPKSSSSSSSSASGPGSYSSGGAKSPAELEKFRQRKEEIFDIKVADKVRKRVFRTAAEIFALEGECGADIEHILPELLAKLWTTSGNGADKYTLNQIVVELMRAITDQPKSFSWSTYDYEQKGEALAGISKLSDKNQKMMLFFFVHGNKGHVYFDNYRSQKAVRDLAAEYQIDYRLLDAQSRVEVAEQSAKKYLDEFKRYLMLVEAGGKNALIPRPWSDKWVPKD